jgi:hypothetical protein
VSTGWTWGARGGVVACAAMLGCAGGDGGPEAVGEAAQALGGAVTLTQAPAGGPGTAQFTTDEFGAADPCCGVNTGIGYAPLGIGTLGMFGVPPAEMTCNMFLEVIEPGASTRALLTSCPAGPQPAAPTTDVTSGGTTRHTAFTLPSVPSLTVDLVQTAVSTVQLDQTYTFTDSSGLARSLVMVFFHDIDVPYQAGFANPNGWTKNLGRRGSTPTSVTIMDDKRKVRVTLSSALGAGTAGIADGYRVAQFGGDNETEDFEAPGLTGLPAAHLNGLFYSAGAAQGNTLFTGEGPGDPDCNGLTDHPAPTVGSSQWEITVPANGSATLVTSTLLASGNDPIIYPPASSCTAGLVVQTGTSGTMIDTQLASNAGLKTYGTSTTMNAGQVGAGLRNALVQFDVSAVPASARIVGALLTLQVRPGYASNAIVNAHPVLVPWADTTETWTSFYGQPAPQYGPIVASAATQTTTSGALTWNVTSLVAAWVAGTQPNDGILLEQSAGSTSFWTSEAANVADRPKLEIKYE